MDSRNKSNISDDNATKKVAADPTQRISASHVSLPEITGFDVEAVHGEGGMAKVYLAVDPGLDRRVAIKMMSSELSDDSEFRTRFRNEAKTVAQFRHPNIVSVFASGEIDGHQYIVMEFVDGGNLADRLKSGSLAEAEVVNIAYQMADALSYSHARNIIHRDFKPGNILFTNDGTPVLSDFGVAKSALPDETALTQVGVVIGSLNYMAPEQRRGEQVTDRIDVYSFGVVLYKMLTGDLPQRTFVGDASDERIRSTLKKQRPDLVDLVCRCLHEDPGQRPSAKECAQVLQDIHKSMVSDSKFSATLRQHKALIFGAPVVLIVAAGLVLGFSGKLPWLTDWGVPTTLIAHDFNVDPPSTSLFVEGVEIGGTANLGPGRHDVVAVAPGYFGKIVEIDIGGESSATSIRLDAMTLPTQDELLHFVSAVEAPRVLDGDLRQISNPTLKRVLDLRILADNGDADGHGQLVDQLDVLASYDDQSSVVTLYLAAESDVVERESIDVLPRLQTVMNSGYALATFWYAIWLSESLSPEDYVSGNPGFMRYCDTMQRSYDQGLNDIARSYLEQGCW